jgi:exonuclease III
MGGISTYLSKITLHVNSFNSPMKRHRLAEWIKIRPTICCLQETYLTGKDKNRIIVKGWKEVFQTNRRLKGSRDINILQTTIQTKIN